MVRFPVGIKYLYFSESVSTDSGTRPGPCSVGSGALFAGLKRLEREVDPSLPSGSSYHIRLNVFQLMIACT